jgi:hypothetical protein
MNTKYAIFARKSGKSLINACVVLMCAEKNYLCVKYCFLFTYFGVVCSFGEIKFLTEEWVL